MFIFNHLPVTSMSLPPTNIPVQPGARLRDLKLALQPANIPFDAHPPPLRIRP